MLLATLVQTSERVRQTRSRTQKIAALAATVAALSREELELGVGFLVGKPRQGKLGVGQAAVREASTATPAATATLELLEVDRRPGSSSSPRTPSTWWCSRSSPAAAAARAGSPTYTWAPATPAPAAS
jgi:hypothetical protein